MRSKAGKNSRVQGGDEEGVSQKIMGPQQKNHTKLRINPRKPLNENQVSLIVERKMASIKTVKYYEIYSTTDTVSTTGQVVDISVITQGVGQLQRIADTVFVQRVDCRLSVNTANSDVFNLVRVIFFNWKVDSALSAPTIADILAFTGSTPLVYGNFNFENRAMYGVWKDLTFNLSGTASNPTKNSQHYLEYSENMNKKRIDFNLGSTSGTGKIYLAHMSDSSAVPYPQLNVNIRMWFMDD